MSELAILLARVSSISKFSTILMKCLLKISARSSALLIVLLLFFKIMDSLWKASPRRQDRQFSKIFYCRRELYGLVSQKKRLLVLRSKLTQKFLWRLKRLLDSSFLVFKNLFLSFDLFIIAFLSSLVIKMQFFERIFIIFLERAYQEQITRCH